MRSSPRSRRAGSPSRRRSPTRSDAGSSRSTRRRSASSSRSTARSRPISRVCARRRAVLRRDELFYLSRLVSGAHNLLYRDRRNTFREIARFVAIDVPAEIRRSVAPIALAALFMFGPAAIAWIAVVRNPAVAPTFIPTAMLDRAQDGVERAKHHNGYIPDPEVFRPVMASRDHREQRAGHVRRVRIRRDGGNRHAVPPRAQRHLARRRVRAVSVEGDSDAARSRSSRRTACSSCRRSASPRAAGSSSPPRCSFPATARAGARWSTTAAAR